MCLRLCSCAPLIIIEFFKFTLFDLFFTVGVELAFNKELADFKQMFTETSENVNVYISEAIHKTFINVDEAGTEAAAVTAIKFEYVTAFTAVEEFTVDRPFVYFIRDDENKEILFMGEYMYAEQ